MRKLIVMNRISLDGFFAGPQGEIDWFIHDPAVDAAAHEMMSPDTLLLGRLTYEMFYGYWPQAAADPNAPQGIRRTAEELRQMNKVVFSGTLPEAAWENTQLVRADPAGAVRALKAGDGPDITIFGSGTIVQQLARAKLVDEYLIILTPVLLGVGQVLFANANLTELELLEARSFASGNVLLHYAV
ncbi:MAG: dihydrofolate reductase family protein [Anaerolineales bacterium]